MGKYTTTMNLSTLIFIFSGPLMSEPSLALFLEASTPEIHSSDTHASEVHVFSDSQNPAETLHRLDFSLNDSRSRQVYFVDHPEMDLAQKGLIIRVRSGKSGSHFEFTLKFRPAPKELWDSSVKSSSKSIECEWDQSEVKKVSSCSISTKISLEEWNRLQHSEVSFWKLLSSDQIGVLKRYFPSLNPQDRFCTFGPLSSHFLEKSSFDIEVWNLDSQASPVLVELSTRSKGGERDEQIQARILFLKEILKERGLSTATQWESKTDFAYDLLKSRPSSCSAI